MKRTATLRWVILLLAQWVHYPASGIPRLPDGSPDLAAPGSTHDLTGTWTLPATRLGGPDGPPKYATLLAADLPEGSVPLKPKAREILRGRYERLGSESPFAKCLPPGLRMVTMQPAPLKILQHPGLTVILYETRGIYRQVFTDGRSLPGDPNPSCDGLFDWPLGRGRLRRGILRLQLTLAMRLRLIALLQGQVLLNSDWRFMEASLGEPPTDGHVDLPQERRQLSDFSIAELSHGRDGVCLRQ